LTPYRDQRLEIAVRLIAALAVMFCMSGCASRAERAAAVQRDVDDMVTVYGPGCEKLVFKTDTDPWRECVLPLATTDRLDRSDLTTTLASAATASCTAAASDARQARHACN